MIRLRCEFGPLRRQMIEDHRIIDPDWIDAARRCAALQARSMVTESRRLVPLPLVNAIAWDATPKSLHAAGILELLTWEENNAGAITRILRADLSLLAARRLTRLGHLPRCFLPILIAPDLLDEAFLVPSLSEADLLLMELAAWMDCGGFSPGSPLSGDGHFDRTRSA